MAWVCGLISLVCERAWTDFRFQKLFKEDTKCKIKYVFYYAECFQECMKIRKWQRLWCWGASVWWGGWRKENCPPENWGAIVGHWKHEVGLHSILWVSSIFLYIERKAIGVAQYLMGISLSLCHPAVVSNIIYTLLTLGLFALKIWRHRNSSWAF